MPPHAAKAPADLVDRLNKSHAEADPDAWKFRILDDDGAVYYYGLFIADEDDWAASGFEPLYEFGAPNVGATRIETRDKKTGEYRPL